MFSECGIKVSNFGGEVVSEFIETKDLEVVDDLVDEISDDEE